MMLKVAIGEEFDVNRDMDLVRDILLQIEQSKTPIHMAEIIGGEDVKAAEKEYLLNIMEQRGLISSNNSKFGARKVHLNINLTWEGHDFLDTVRDPEIWAKTKDGAKSAGAFSFDLLIDLAKGFAKQHLEEITGISL